MLKFSSLSFHVSVFKFKFLSFSSSRKFLSFSSSRKVRKNGKNVATKRAFRDASCIPIKGPASSHEASPGTRRRSRGTSALALRGGRPRSGRSERFPARSRPCCSCQPEASRSGAEAERGGLRCFSVRRENANFTKAHLFVATALRSQNRAFQEKRVNVPKKALPF